MEAGSQRRYGRGMSLGDGGYQWVAPTDWIQPC
jgi:hypothetical protein